MTIADVRRIYSELRDRAHEANPSEWLYIALLWNDWDKTLGAFGDETPVPDRHAEFLERVIANPALPASDLLEWMDAYPDGIRERLPGGLFAQPMTTKLFETVETMP